MTKIQKFKMFIDGQWVDSESGKTIETLNPENNEVWAMYLRQVKKMLIKLLKLHKMLLKNLGQNYIQEIEQNI